MHTIILPFSPYLSMCHGHAIYDVCVARFEKDDIVSVNCILVCSFSPQYSTLHNTDIVHPRSLLFYFYLILLWIKCSPKAFRGVMCPPSPKAVQESFTWVQLAVRVGMYFVGEVVPAKVWESLLHIEGQLNLEWNNRQRSSNLHFRDRATVIVIY